MPVPFSNFFFSIINRCIARAQISVKNQKRRYLPGALASYSNTGKTAGIILGNILVAPTLNSNDSDEERKITREIEIPEPATFSHAFQLRQAAHQTINSSTVMLNSTLQTLLTVYNEYSLLLESAIKTLSIAVEINPSIYDHTGIDSQMSTLRSELGTKKSAIGDSLFVFEESVKLLQTAANVSFLVGNEVSSNLAFSHCNTIQQEVSHLNFF